MEMMRFCAISFALLAGVVSAVERPEVIDLPMGFRPEGITMGRDWTTFVGSLADGAIWKGDLREGTGEVVIEGVGSPSVGMDFDKRTDYLFVAGGPSGTARVYDMDYKLVANIALSNGSTFVNDVVVTKDYAYFTDSFQAQFYAVPLSSSGELMDVDHTTISFGGDFESVSGGFNANGVVASDDGSKLIVANSATTSLYLVDSMTGEATSITLHGLLGPDGSVNATAALSSISPDGLARRRNTLWACENGMGRGTEFIAEINLSEDWTYGYISRILTSDLLNTPTTVDRWFNGLYGVNAKFRTPEDEYANQTYEVIRIDRDEAMMT